MFSQEVAEIYALKCPATGEVRYIGKANNAALRLKSHLKDCYARNTPLYQWMRGLLADGEAPLLEVLCVTWDWRATERQIIAQWRAETPLLLNVAAGGSEPHCPTKTRAENGRKNAAARQSTAGKRRLWELKQRLGSALKRGHVSEETKEKMRAAYRANPVFWSFLSGM